MRFEEIEHTADLSIRAYGGTLEELFENAALGMFSLVFDIDRPRAFSSQRSVLLPPDDPVRLLRKWLSELLYLHETDGLLFLGFEVRSVTDGLSGVARGVRCDEVEGQPVASIKAVTYHGLEITERDGQLTATIVFDT